MKYFLGFLTTVILIILLIVLLVGGGNNEQKKGPTSDKPLVEYAETDASTRMIVDGPVNANSTHLQERITVARDRVVFERVRGYDGNVEFTQTYLNNASSYASFLRSLQLAGFTLGDKSPEMVDERGRCPLGNRYIFEFNDEGKVKQRFWSTSCNEEKTYGGKTPLTVRLFKEQVPNYYDLQSQFEDKMSY